jgi:hypothetical protein
LTCSLPAYRCRDSQSHRCVSEGGPQSEVTRGKHPLTSFGGGVVHVYHEQHDATVRNMACDSHLQATLLSSRSRTAGFGCSVAAHVLLTFSRLARTHPKGAVLCSACGHARDSTPWAKWPWRDPGSMGSRRWPGQVRSGQVCYSAEVQGHHAGEKNVREPAEATERRCPNEQRAGE